MRLAFDLVDWNTSAPGVPTHRCEVRIERDCVHVESRSADGRVLHVAVEIDSGVPRALVHVSDDSERTLSLHRLGEGVLLSGAPAQPPPPELAVPELLRDDTTLMYVPL